MAHVYSVLLLLHLALLVVALIDCVAADERGIRGPRRTTWIFLILFLSPLGAIAWFVAGQPAPAIRAADGRILRPSREPRPARKPVLAFIGPEDDPDFVLGLAQDLERRRAQES